jgi:PAS domain S-box-containing protein
MEPTPTPGRTAEFQQSARVRLKLVTPDDAEMTDDPALFPQLFDSFPDAALVLDGAGRVALANAQAESLLGRSRDDLLGRPVESLVPGSFSSLPAHARPGAEAARELIAVRKDGNWVPVDFVVRPLGGERLLATARDATHRRRAEERLRESEARYRGLVEGSIQGVLIHQDGKIRYANPACARLFGYDNSAGLLDLDWQVLVAPEHRPALAARVEACLRGEEVAAHPGWQGVRRDGTRIWLESIVSPMSWRDRSAAVAFLNDITGRKQLEEQLRQSQKMEAVGRLAGGVAHDFNNLLTIINGYSEIVQTQLPPDSPVLGLIEEIAEAGSRAASLTRQLLTFSRKQVAEQKTVHLHAVVGDLEKMLRRLIGEDVIFTINLGVGVGLVKADPTQLEQVLMNLVVNARDAMPQGGRLTIETANAELDHHDTRAHPDVRPGPYVVLAVTDTGVGMDEVTRVRVFEPFFSTKGPDKGTGLGLAVVHGIVKQSGGHIAVDSEPGRGTTFRIYLPRVEDAAAPGKSHYGLVKAPRGSETILLTEDEPAVRALARHVLTTHGYTVLEADHGKAALHVAEECRGPIHLLVTDVIMPGMSGPQLTDRLSAERTGLKVLYLSGHTDSAIRQAVLKADAAFLQKPFTPTALAQKVREVLDR